MKRLLATILLIVNIVQLCAFAQTTTDAQIKGVEQGLLPVVLIKGDPSWSIAERMKFHKAPALSVAVIKDFKIEWAKAYGLKDLETGEPATTETLFQAGSISKSVNAMVAMKKVDQGRISLDEDINAKLTSWKLPDNEFTAKKKVTLRNLLSHTAGTTVHGFPGYAVTEKVPTLQQILDGTAPANTAAVRVDFEPGSRFRYSGGGTTVSQLALMDIEKKPYPDIAKETVLAPLGMSNSTYSQPLPPDWRKKAATGYRSNGLEVTGKIHVYPEMAAAGLWTTPTDLAKFAIELQLSLAGKSNKVLTKQSVETMTTSYKDDVGLGFFIERHGNALYFGHGGADEGFRAELVVSRDKGYGVAVMVNSDNGQILREVIRGVAREYGWDEFLPAPVEIISLDASKVADFAGRFQVNPDRVLTITPVTAGSKTVLQAKPTGDPAFELLPISETTFIRRDANIKYNFVRPTGATTNGSFPPADMEIVGQAGSTPTKRLTAEQLVPFEMLLAGKISEAIEGYRKIFKETPRNVTVSENRLNVLGYRLLEQKKVPEAIALLKLNVEFYPNSWNVYDSLADAYAANSEKDLAITNYKKSLELNPQNEKGREKLKKLGQ
ncbi:MAG TPA: serine hydrolase [Pyrinomonadaceae bacterium]|nr:serine hydrolase [Pyrinomonadaceae bacterium]